MIQDFDMELAKNDVIMMASVYLVQHILDTQVNPSKPVLFNDPWTKNALAKILGFALHALFTNKITLYAKQTLNNSNPGVNNAISDIVKYGTVFIVSEFVSAQLLGKTPDFGIKWQMESGLRIAAYCAFDLVESSLPKLNLMESQSLYNTLLKIGVGELVAYSVINSTLTTTNISKILSLLVGYTIYELVGKNLLLTMNLPKSSTSP